MHRATKVEARPGFRIWIRYDDGVEGEVDLSDLAGKGVFAAWDERSVFESVGLGPGGSVAWPGDIELCPDAIYLRLTGKRPEEIFPALTPAAANA